MKRPAGYDRGGAPEPTRPSARPARTPQKPRSSAPRPDRAPQPRRTVEVPAKRTPPPVVRADREARAELRQAARDRRRYERAEVRRFTVRSRRRRTALLVTLGAVVVLGAMLAIAVFSPILALKTITVEGTSRVAAADVEAAIDDQIGTPLALLDTASITDALSAFPLIRSFTTEIVPPDTLVVSITEREPVAVVASGSGWDLVDPAGVVVQTVQQLPDDLPRLYLPTAGVDSDAFRAEVGVILGLPDKLAGRVVWMTATTSDDVQFQLSGAGQRVFWGSAEDNAFKATVLTALIKAQDKGDAVEYNVSSPASPFVSEITDATSDPTVTDPSATSTGAPTPTATPTP